MEIINSALYCNEWLKIKQKEIKPASYDKYKKVINKYLLNFFKEHSICSLNEEIIDNYLHELSSSGLSCSMVKMIRIVLKAIYTSAENQYGLNHIDFSLIKINDEKKDSQALNDNEIKIIEDYCFNTINLMNLSILLALYTGIRIGELCALKYEDIDIDRRTINIYKRSQRIDNEQEGSKTIYHLVDLEWPAKRVIVIPDKIYDYIKTYIDIYEHKPTDYFLTRNSNMFEQRTLQDKIKKLGNQLHINLSLNILRNTFKDHCIDAGIDIKIILEILGISRFTIVLDNQNISDIEYQREQLNKV